MTGGNGQISIEVENPHGRNRESISEARGLKPEFNTTGC